jgi:hypothetical protein
MNSLPIYYFTQTVDSGSTSGNISWTFAGRACNAVPASIASTNSNHPTINLFWYIQPRRVLSFMPVKATVSVAFLALGMWWLSAASFFDHSYQ